MLLPAVKINVFVTLKSNALEAHRVTAGLALDCAGSELSLISAYVR